MKPLPHEYVVRLAGEPTGYASVSSDGLPALRVAAPADYDGPGDAWSPEHLLLASLQTCLLLTFRAVANASQLPFVGLAVEALGTVDRKDGVTRFTEIILRPRLTLPPGSNHDRARRALERSEKACLVSASLSTPIRLESSIGEADAGAATP